MQIKKILPEMAVRSFGAIMPGSLHLCRWPTGRLTVGSRQEYRVIKRV